MGSTSSRVRLELVQGVPYVRILDMAEKEKLDIIILNTHGKSVIERALVGSTAERVIRGAHIPVLSVPPMDGDRADVKS